jgi:predicted 3-demethylubiquinone-9 3-methyltransferase (glyoxalase superfamily)
MKGFGICLWFDHQAEDAVRFYQSLFKSSKVNAETRYGKSASQLSGQPEGSLMMIDFDLENLNLLALNAGPIFKFSPSFSLTVACRDEKEIDSLWAKLSEGGTVRMGLDRYPWSEKYGWTSDRFGVEWQLTISPDTEKITPSLLFVDSIFGKGKEALDLYTGLFANSKVDIMAGDDKTGTVMYSKFHLGNQGFSLMEGQGKHGHKFTNASSIMVFCESQAEIDLYWDRLAEGGQIEECGWLKDKFGVSWQICPDVLRDYVKDNSKYEKAMSVIGQMKKIDMNKVIKAVEG